MDDFIKIKSDILYIASDIEIFILTYNRAAILSQTINSILNQTVRGCKIIIYDNGSTDETKLIADNFLAEGVEYIKNPENNHLGAWEEIKKLCCKEWMMIFHDDDIMHPDYIKTVLSNVNNYSNISLVGSNMSQFENIDMIKWKIKEKKSHYIFTSISDFATLLYEGFSLPFCSAVYKTKVFKLLKLEFEIYNKLFDRPFMMNAANYGNVIVLKEKYIFVRKHNLQDSNTVANGKYVTALISLNKYYFNVLGTNIFKKSGRTFLLRNYNRLYGSYEWMGGRSSGYSFSKFMELARNDSATSDNSIIVGFIYDLFFGVPLRIIKKTLSFIK